MGGAEVLLGFRRGRYSVSEAGDFEGWDAFFVSAVWMDFDNEKELHGPGSFQSPILCAFTW